MSRLNTDKITGGKVGNLEGYKCARCGQNHGFIFMDGGLWAWFCSDLECLKEDSTVSRQERIPDERQSRDASTIFGVGSRYYNAHVAKLKIDNNSKELLCRWVEKPNNFLIVLGVPGTGKTYICMALANLFLEKKAIVKYMNARRFFEEVQQAISYGKSQYEKIRQLARAEILILDDIGASANSEWQREVILDLVDQRYNEQKPTIITSNFSQPQMIEILGDRTTRRIMNKENLTITVTEFIG
jgi:DNA replication protein DnaC